METRARLRDSDFMGEVVSILCPVWLLTSRLNRLTPRNESRRHTARPFHRSLLSGRLLVNESLSFTTANKRWSVIGGEERDDHHRTAIHWRDSVSCLYNGCSGTLRSFSGSTLLEWAFLSFPFGAALRRYYKNYSSKREDLEEEDQREDERNVIL